MHGGINWGDGTRWEWKNALDLCAGTTRSAATVECFEYSLQHGRNWSEAIEACRTAGLGHETKTSVVVRELLNYAENGAGSALPSVLERQVNTKECIDGTIWNCRYETQGDLEDWDSRSCDNTGESCSEDGIIEGSIEDDPGGGLPRAEEEAAVCHRGAVRNGAFFWGSSAAEADNLAVEF